MTRRKYDLVIFDMDGTLADTSEGIFNCVRYAESELRLKPIPEDELREFVGPPPAKMYKKKYMLSDEDAMRAARKHREYGTNKGYKESVMYPEIAELLKELIAKGYKVAVATLKKEETAIDLLKYHGLYEMFDVVRGMNSAESCTKSQLINEVMCTLNTENAVLIGDTYSDCNGAKESNIDFIGVSYGFGFDGKEEDICIANAPMEIKNYLFGVGNA